MVSSSKTYHPLLYFPCYWEPVMFWILLREYNCSNTVKGQTYPPDMFGLTYESAKDRVHNLKTIAIPKSKKLPFLPVLLGICEQVGLSFQCMV